MKSVLLTFCFVLYLFGSCEELKYENNASNSFVGSKLGFSSTLNTNFKIYDKNTKKEFFSANFAPNYLSSVLLGGGYNENIILAFSNGYAYKIISNQNQEVMINPQKSGIIAPITLIRDYKDILAFIFARNAAIIYDSANNIQKTLSFENHSKIIDAKLNEQDLFLLCFDRNIYKLNTTNSSFELIAQAPNIANSLDLLDLKPIVALNNGFAFYENKSIKISNNNLTKVLVNDDKIYFGDSKGNVFIYSKDLKLENSIKLNSDEAIKDMKILDNLYISLWNGQVFVCKTKS